MGRKRQLAKVSARPQSCAAPPERVSDEKPRPCACARKRRSFARRSLGSASGGRQRRGLSLTRLFRGLRACRREVGLLRAAIARSAASKIRGAFSAPAIENDRSGIGDVVAPQRCRAFGKRLGARECEQALQWWVNKLQRDLIGKFTNVLIEGV